MIILSAKDITKNYGVDVILDKVCLLYTSVAFGALFPGDEDRMHQKDERLSAVSYTHLRKSILYALPEGKELSLGGGDRTVLHAFDGNQVLQRFDLQFPVFFDDFDIVHQSTASTPAISG